MRITFLLLTLLILFFSCENDDGKGRVLLKAKNKQIDKIIDSVVIDGLLKNTLLPNWEKTKIAIIDIENKNDTIFFVLSDRLQHIHKQDLPYFDSVFYGVYEYKKQMILVSGECADILFSKTKGKKEIEFLKPENAVDNTYPVPPFDPEIITYYLEDDSIKFLHTNYIY